MSEVLKPSQLPGGVYTVDGRKSIQYNGEDVSLYCRQEANGNMKVMLADMAQWDELQQDWRDEVIENDDAIKLFGHTRVYNPLQDRVVDLVC